MHPEIRVPSHVVFGPLWPLPWILYWYLQVAICLLLPYPPSWTPTPSSRSPSHWTRPRSCCSWEILPSLIQHPQITYLPSWYLFLAYHPCLPLPPLALPLKMKKPTTFPISSAHIQLINWFEGRQGEALGRVPWVSFSNKAQKIRMSCENIYNLPVTVAAPIYLSEARLELNNYTSVLPTPDQVQIQ